MTVKGKLSGRRGCARVVPATLNVKIFARIWLALSLAAPMAPAITITTQPTNQTVFAGSTVTFVVAASGAGPFAYQWQVNSNSVTNILISTVAGNGTGTFAGDNGLATSASLNLPYGVATDTNGNLFIADTSNNRIRRVSTNGIIGTVAGGGTFGDGSPATAASLNNPFGVAADGLEIFTSRTVPINGIRKVGTNSIINTIAGTGTGGFNFDGILATNANLSSPVGVAMDNFSNIFISDDGNNRIRRVTTNFIFTVAGNGPNAGNPGSYTGDGVAATNTSLYYPHGATVDAIGNLFIADTYNNRIRKVGTNGIISTVAGNGSQTYAGDGGLATNASLSSPSGVAVDAGGNLFIADTGNNVIRKVGTNGIITTVAGNTTGAYAGDGGVATNASLNAPFGLAFDTVGNLLVADTQNNVVRKVALAGSAKLVLSNVATNQSGSYRVIITNATGSVTSSVVTLTVQPLYPVITNAPQNQSVPIGSTVHFNVGASGVAPLAYQWYFTNGIYAGATNASFSFGPALTNAAGNYQVIVTNLYGSATSSAALTVLLQPYEYGINVSNKAMVLKLASAPGSTNRLWAATNLNSPITWLAIATNVAGSNGLYQVTDTNTSGKAMKFYRVSTP